MANVKSIELEALVPFDWIDKLDANQLSLFSAFLSPSYGLEMRYEYVGLIPNPDGSDGRTTIYKLFIEGESGTRFSTFDTMIEAIEQAGGDVRVATIEDIEDGRGQVNRVVHKMDRSALQPA